jgi:hypothetical protein
MPGQKSIPAMRNSLFVLSMLAARATFAQDTAQQVTAPQEAIPHTAIRAVTLRTAPSQGTPETPAVAEIAKGASVDVIGRDRGWVRVRLEGWVRESDVVIADTTLTALSAADIRSDPAQAKGKLVKWDVQAVSLQAADALRTGLQTGEPYLLALGPGAEKTLVYLAIPQSLLATARSLPSMADITVTARVRNGRSEPAGVPILDVETLTKR